MTAIDRQLLSMGMDSGPSGFMQSFDPEQVAARIPHAIQKKFTVSQ